ncbi:NUDIX hydrolase [Candidatus Woesearchaeota archaeon]|nr:NUDIX hydrolase [Candidatus Woesearchaeota archaeon]
MGVKAPYQPKDEIFTFLRPAIAVDVVLLSIIRNNLQVALIQRQDEPYYGKFALPGRFVRYDEPIETTAKKAIEGKGNIKTDNIYLEQLHTFGQDLVRDTRIRTISTVYYGFIDPDTINSQPDNTFTWFKTDNLPPLGFDHKKIIKSSIERVRRRMFTTDVIFNLIPKEFTLTEFQHACETFFGEELDKRNFRKKINELYTLKDLKRTKMTGAHRPAKLYTYVKMK